MSNFTVYRASAGSGKTFSLVIEYLSIALSDSSGKTYRKILGVTFTNKAASELKERIIRFLKEVAVPSTDPNYNKVVAEKLKERLGISDLELGTRAQRTLTDILHNYSRLSISTIDKFVHRLIRSFARELKLQGDFEIEMDSERVYQKVAQRVINLVGKDEQLTSWIISWLIGRLEENSGTGDYENSLVKFMNNLSTDEAAPFKQELLKLTPADMQLAKENLKKLVDKFETTLHSYGTEGWKIITDAGLSVDDFFQKASGPAGYFRKIANKVPDGFIANSYVIKSFESGKLYSGKSPQSSQIDAITPALSDLYFKIVNLLENDLQQYKKANLFRKELPVLGLAGKMEEILRAYLDEKNLVLIADFNKKIAEVVVNEPAPFIYELLGERYDHFLIDEFQDTSILQWQNFLPLVDNSLGKGGKTLIVGDGKQSIYRFRGGEVEQFQQLPGIYQAPDSMLFRQYTATLHRNNNLINILENYRSTRNVVNFNNRFIESLSTFLSERYLPIFEDGKQDAVSKEEGYVLVKVLEKDPDEEDHIDQLNIQQLLKDLQRTKDQGFGYRDCCVLVNKNDHGSLVARELLAKNIPIISEESLTVLFSQKSRLVLGCLQLLNDNSAGNGQLNVIENAASLGILGEDVMALFKKYCFKNPSGNRGLSCNVSLLFRDLGILESIDTLQSKDLYSMTELLARRLGFMDSYDPFVQFFLDQTLSCLQKEGNHLADCINWWENNADKAKVVMPEGLNAVRIMTIHKSKGLEFENVFMPFIHWKQMPTKKVLWVSPEPVFDPLKVGLVPNSKSALTQTGYESLNELELEKDNLDEANKMYVALTRAARNLFVYTATTRDKKGVAPHFYNWVITQPEYNPEKNTFELGELNRKTLSNHTKPALAAPIVLDKFVSAYDERKLIIGFQAPKFWDPENTSTEKDRGNVIHALLNNINSMKDLNPVIEKFSRSGFVSEEETNELFASLQSIIERGEKEGWMGEALSARNEMELLSLSDGKADIIRPDRVVFGKDSTWVIDYKTGSQLPKHKEQVQRYIRALKDINYPNVRGTLIYLETGASVEI